MLPLTSQLQRPTGPTRAVPDSPLLSYHLVLLRRLLLPLLLHPFPSLLVEEAALDRASARENPLALRKRRMPLVGMHLLRLKRDEMTVARTPRRSVQ